MSIDYSKLINAAAKARENAYAPYSQFKVGAALLCTDGKVFTGCNIEFASYSPTNCAERTALFNAVSEGEREFEAIAIVGNGIISPCGVCRQALFEFGGEKLSVIMAKNDDEYIVKTLGELFPMGFGANSLDAK
jgi:cytidine deaminase